MTSLLLGMRMENSRMESSRVNILRAFTSLGYIGVLGDLGKDIISILCKELAAAYYKLRQCLQWENELGQCLMDLEWTLNGH